MNSSLIGYPLYTALSHIWAKSLVNYYNSTREKHFIHHVDSFKSLPSSATISNVMIREWKVFLHYSKWRHLCRGVRPLPIGVLYMILKNLMVRFQWCRGFEEYEALLHCDCSQVHSDPTCSWFTKFFASTWHKAEWMGQPMRLELTRVGLLV